MRSIFCGNFEFDARESDLERLFKRYGRVDRVDMKSGFAFIYMDDERDAEYAIRALDRTEFGRKGRRLRVEWTKQERGPRRQPSSRRSDNLRPSKTLFVINFPFDTRTRDLEKHFEPYGKIVNVRIRKNFAFVQYESQEDATKALDATNHSKMMDRVISVEYAARDDDDRRNGYSPDRRDHDRSPDRRRRSPSPYRRERGSPDYGRGSSPAPYQTEKGSPDYRHGPSSSPHPKRRNSPDHDDAKARNSSPHGKGRATPNYRDRSRSPRRETRASPHFPNRSQSSPVERRASPHYPNRRESSREQRASPDYPDQSPRQSPRQEVRSRTDYPPRGQSPREGERHSSKYRDGSKSPRHEPKASPDYHVGLSSPDGEIKDSPDYGDRIGSADPEKMVDNGYNGQHRGTAYGGEEGSPYSDGEVVPNSKLDSRDSPEYEEERD